MSPLQKKPFGTRGKVHEITPASAGWRHVGFGLWRLRPGDTAAEATGSDEVILVVVEGKVSLTSRGPDGAAQDWGILGDRMNVFEKTPPHALYLSAGSRWQAVAETDCSLAVCAAPGRGGHGARRLGPGGIALTSRGSGTNLRHIHNIAMENETSLAIKLVTGTPSTMPADTPTKTLETALGACSLLTDAAATVKAIETYTGCRKAGSIRAINNTVKLEVNMDITLLIVNNPNASNITFFRLIPENNKGVAGADAATTNAKTLTVQPA